MTPWSVQPGPAPCPGEVILHRQWPSRLDVKDEVIAVLSTALLDRGWVLGDDEPWLVLCLDEVVVNAMLHGNEGDPYLTIDVHLFHHQDRWCLHVADHGEGFSPAQVPDNEDPGSLLLEHGRGIRIMSEWLDRLTFYRNGATAVLERRIDPTIAKEPHGL